MIPGDIVTYKLKQESIGLVTNRKGIVVNVDWIKNMKISKKVIGFLESYLNLLDKSSDSITN